MRPEGKKKVIPALVPLEEYAQRFAAPEPKILRDLRRGSLVASTANGPVEYAAAGSGPGPGRARSDQLSDGSP